MSEITMKAPDGVTSASVAGVEYKVGADGFIDASITHLAALVEHGFKQSARNSSASDGIDASAEPVQSPAKKVAAK